MLSLAQQQQQHLPYHDSYFPPSSSSSPIAMPHRVLEAAMVSSPASTAVSSPSLASVSSAASTAASSVASPGTGPTSSGTHAVQPPRSCAADAATLQALEIARDCPDAMRDPTVSKMLEGCIGSIWAKVQASPDSYVMTRDEFSVFNFFQNRFVGNDLAKAARARYWNKTWA